MQTWIFPRLLEIRCKAAFQAWCPLAVFSFRNVDILKKKCCCNNFMIELLTPYTQTSGCSAVSWFLPSLYQGHLLSFLRGEPSLDTIPWLSWGIFAWKTKSCLCWELFLFQGAESSCVGAFKFTQKYPRCRNSGLVFRRDTAAYLCSLMLIILALWNRLW